MKLTYKKGREDKIHISIDGEYRATVDENYFFSLGIENNAEITEEDYENLIVAVQKRRAFNKALDLLSLRDHSKKELKEKLRQKGYADEADEVISELEDMGYVDDERFAENYTRYLNEQKGYGKRRIRQELYAKGIDRETAEKVLEETQDSPEKIKALLQSKYPQYKTDEKTKKRAINALLRYGYAYGEIAEAMEEEEE